MTVSQIVPSSIGKDLEKTCRNCYLYDVFFRKVKMLKMPERSGENSWSYMVKVVVLKSDWAWF